MSLEHSEDRKPVETLHNKIQNTIESGDVKMISRSRFILQTILFAVVMSILSLGIIYLMSLFLFMLNRDAPPNISMYTLFASLDVLSLFIFLLAIAGIVVVEILFRKYSIGYRLPALSVFVAIVVLVLFTSFLVNKVRFHDFAHAFLRENKFDRIDRRLYRTPMFKVNFRQEIIHFERPQY